MSTVYMHLQNTNSQNNIVGTGSIIYFNDAQPVPNITYDPSSGVLHMGQAGLYYFNFNVVAQDLNPLNQENIKITLVTSEGEEITVESSYSEDEVTGAGIINIESEGTQVYLRNDGDPFMYGSGIVVANLSIVSIDMNDPTVPVNPTPDCSCGTVVNLSNGRIDPLNPLTWPIIFEALQISFCLKRCISLRDTCTNDKLEKLLGLNKGVLDFILIKQTFSPILSSVCGIIDAAIIDLNTLITENAGLVSMDAYIGHSSVGTVPAIASGDLPVWSLVAGPPYPQIISRNGTIKSFAAEYGALASVDVSLFGAVGGLIATFNQILSTVAGAVQTLITAFASLGTMLAGLGSPLPSDYADILTRLIIEQVSVQTPSSNHHMHAILWHATRDSVFKLGGAVNWHKVSEVDLGAIPFLQLSPLDNLLSNFGDILAAAGNVVSTLFTLFGTRGTPNQVLNSMPLNANIENGLNHAIKSGDYLMVQFTLVGDDNTTILAGVFASNLMASVLIQ